jgi:thermitase
MKFEKDRLGYAFEDDYPESYGPEDRARLRAILPTQVAQLGRGDPAADARVIGILIGRRCGDQERAQPELLTRRDGSVCLVARGELVLPAAEQDSGAARRVLAGYAAQRPGIAAEPGAYVRFRRPAASASDVDRVIDSCAVAKVPAWPNYLATMAAVGKGLGGAEPAPRPPATQGAPGAPRAVAPAGAGPQAFTAAPPAAAPVLIAVIDTGIPAARRSDGWLDIARTPDNIDLLDVLPAGPDGLLDYGAGHGAFVTGIIQRVAPRAEVRMYRAADTDGFATDNDIADAILRAHDEGAQIINLSLGIRTADDTPPPAIAEALATVRRDSAGATVVVAAAGNYGDRSTVWPAAFDGVEAVAGLTAYLTPAPWSSYGDVRFSTVAEGIRSTYVSGTESPVFDPQPDEFGADAWALWSGTSFAAPQIAGAVARMSYEEGIEPRAAVDKLDAYGKEIVGYGKAMRILQGIG